jgi:hypothetical protein
MITLLNEWATALDNVTLEHRRVLRDRYQVPMFVASHSSAAQIGVQRIQTNGRFWEPSSAGIDAVIIMTNRHTGDHIEDLLAFRPAEPDKWWLRTGDGTWLGYWELGTRLVGCPSYLEPPTFTQHHERTDDPLHVYQNPLDWLRNYCDGTVPLCREAYGDLIHVQAELIADSDRHIAMIRNWAQRPFAMPKITVRAQEEAA